LDRADFVHLVRRSEQASADDSARYRRGVMLFAALGYAWVVGSVLLAAGTLWWLSSVIMQGRFRAWYVGVLLTALGLLWTSLRALWCRIEPPEGVRIGPQDAPALFEALERIRRKIKGPPLHGVYLDGDLNASIRQLPRWGLFGGARNYLTIGLPLLLAVDRQRVLAILAHEYGHLRGDHGRFSAWIYRTRASWTRLHEGLAGDSIFAMLTQGFLHWYFPRFVARTFALARQDEYEADRIAGKLLGSDVAAAALVEIAIKGQWLGAHFWREHWAVAARHALPIGPYARMGEQLALAVPNDFARATLKEHLRRISGLDDTHPVLRDRVEALGAEAVLPKWSRGSGVALLGAKAPAYIAQFDKKWCREHATDWKRHHARLGRVRTRLEELQRQETRNADAWTELVDLQLRLDPGAPVQAHYEQALALVPTHAPALRGLAGCLPPAQREERMALLQRLHEAHTEYRWWSAQAAVAQLEADPAHDAQALKVWRARLKEAEAAEGRAWDELHEPPFLTHVARHDLRELELDELCDELAGAPGVQRAWLLRKHLREFPARRCYLLFVEAPRLDEEAGWQLCQHLQRTLPAPGPLRVLLPNGLAKRPDIERQAGAPVYPAVR
jgi:Zn-dependent protease with chaperone function